jgi:hypothetical protein
MKSSKKAKNLPEMVIGFRLTPRSKSRKRLWQNDRKFSVAE